MREHLNDILEHTQPLGILSVIKITGEKKSTLVESYDDGLSVVLKAQAIKPIKEFVGEFALHQLSILSGYLSFPNFASDDATVSINTREIGGVDTPTELEFDAGNNGTKATYRFMDAKFAKQPKLTKPSWSATVNLSKSKIAEFERLAKIFGSLKPMFMTSIEDGKLYFSLGGTSSSDSNAKVFISDIDGSIKGEPLFPISQFLTILKMSKEDEVEICLNESSMKMTIESEDFQYDYYLPARNRE